jgi:hypothetical protein
MQVGSYHKWIGRTIVCCVIFPKMFIYKNRRTTMVWYKFRICLPVTTTSVI